MIDDREILTDRYVAEKMREKGEGYKDGKRVSTFGILRGICEKEKKIYIASERERMR